LFIKKDEREIKYDKTDIKEITTTISNKEKPD